MKKEYRNAKRTKRMIREATIELLSEKKNLECVMVTEICRRADIAKSTFYNHYTDVYEVAEEFENELLENLSDALREIETASTGYDTAIQHMIDYLKKNEEPYRKTIGARDVQYFIEKLKFVLSKKVFENKADLPFSDDKIKRYIQIRLLTNACVDTICDYFRGVIDATLDEVGDIILSFLQKLSEK